MQGRRVYPRESDGHLWLQPGDYGFDGTHWECYPPGTKHAAGNLVNHKVVEHEDGTITVSPSILITYFGDDAIEHTWHGYLEHGVWREC